MHNANATADIKNGQSDRGVIAGWDAGWAIVNVRGNPEDPQFVSAISGALGVAWPVAVCSTVMRSGLRIIWAGPDDWFVLSKNHSPDQLMNVLRQALNSQHCAITDVSSGYALLNLTGPRVRELMAEGCPLDLHPRQFCVGQSAGSVFFKASVWLWQTEEVPTYEVLVRTSFQGYVWLMLKRTTAESGFFKRIFA